MSTTVPERPEDVLVRQAKRARRRGEQRKAMLCLREATCTAPGDARVWTLYAAECLRAGRAGEAERALTQALWLRRRAKDHRRRVVTERLLDELRSRKSWLGAA